MQRSPGLLRGLVVDAVFRTLLRRRRVCGTKCLIHAVHAAATVVVTAAAGFLLFGDFGDHGFGGQHQAGDGGRVLQSSARDLRRVDDAGSDQVLVDARSGVVAEVGVLRFVDIRDSDCAFFARIMNDHPKWFFDRPADDVGADLLVAFQRLDQSVDRGGAAEEGNTAARDDAFFNGSAGGVHRVFDTGLLFLHLGFGGCTDLDDGDSADQLGETLLELLTVVVGGGLFDLGADFLDATGDLGVFAAAVDDGGVVLVDGDALGGAEVFDLDALELDAEVFGDRLAAGEGCDVFEHRLATIAEAGGLYRGNIQRAAQFVDDESCERFAVYVLSNDEQRLGGAGDLLEQGEEVLHRRDLLLVDKDVGVLEGRFHALGISHKVGAEIASIELHAFNDVELGFHGARLFNGDDAVLADLLHRFRDDGADLLIRICGDGAELGDHVAGDGLGELGESAADHDAVGVALADDGLNSLVDAALERHRVGAGGNGLDAFAIDCLCKHSRGRRTVAGYVGGLRGDFLDHLRAHVFEAVTELDFLGYGDAVLGDGRRAELLFDDDVAALGTERHLYRVGERVDATQDRLTRIFSMQNLLCHCVTPVNSK